MKLWALLAAHSRQTWRPGRLELYVDGWSRASSTAAATNTSASFGIYGGGWGFSTSQDFNGDIALIACFRLILDPCPAGAMRPVRGTS